MKNQTVIRKLLAFVMLLVFTFSMMPKKYLHDWLADHTDFYASASHSDAAVAKAVLNCHCEDLVVSTPFVHASYEPDVSPALVYTSFLSAPYLFFFLNTHITTDLRGPPACQSA